MTFHQSVHTCGCGRFGASGCHAVVATTDADLHDEAGNLIHPAGAVVWTSHGPDDSHPACRLDDTAGIVAADQRTGAAPGATVTAQPMCSACQVIFGVVTD